MKIPKFCALVQTGVNNVLEVCWYTSFMYQTGKQREYVNIKHVMTSAPWFGGVWLLVILKITMKAVLKHSFCLVAIYVLCQKVEKNNI